MKDLLINQADYLKINPAYSVSLRLALALDKKIDSYMKGKATHSEITDKGDVEYTVNDSNFEALVKEVFREGN